MAASLNYNSISVKPFGTRVDIPNDDIAKLMYYLSCIDTVISYGKTDIFTDYQHYYLLTIDERIELVKLVLLFNPKLFIDAGIFIIDQRLLPYDMGNQFYEITDNRINVHFSEQIMIGGKYVKVLKAMACNSNWLYTYYINPLNNITNPPQKAQSTYSSRNYTKEEDNDCCLIF